MNTSNFPKIRTKPIFEQIIDQIRIQLISGTLKVNDNLPPERDMAQMMGVNRHAVREAYRVLEFIGIIERRSGIGTIIRSVGNEFLIERIVKEVDFSQYALLTELLELRMALEPTMAELAAVRASEKEISEMENAIIELKAEIASSEKTDYADVRLHLSIAKASHNMTFFKLAQPLLTILSQYRERLEELPDKREDLVNEHEAIFQAIKDRNPAKAGKAMKHHMLEVKKRLELTKDV